MSVKALVFTLFGAVVALFYAFESFFSFLAHGVTAPLLVKLLICGAGVYFFWRNVRLVRTRGFDRSSVDRT